MTPYDLADKALSSMAPEEQDAVKKKMQSLAPEEQDKFVEELGALAPQDEAPQEEKIQTLPWTDAIRKTLEARGMQNDVTDKALSLIEKDVAIKREMGRGVLQGTEGLLGMGAGVEALRNKVVSPFVPEQVEQFIKGPIGSPMTLGRKIVKSAKEALPKDSMTESATGKVAQFAGSVAPGLATFGAASAVTPTYQGVASMLPRGGAVAAEALSMGQQNALITSLNALADELPIDQVAKSGGAGFVMGAGTQAALHPTVLKRLGGVISQGGGNLGKIWLRTLGIDPQVASDLVEGFISRKSNGMSNALKEINIKYNSILNGLGSEWQKRRSQWDTVVGKKAIQEFDEASAIIEKRLQQEDDNLILAMKQSSEEDLLSRQMVRDANRESAKMQFNTAMTSRAQKAISYMQSLVDHHGKRIGVTMQKLKEAYPGVGIKLKAVYKNYDDAIQKLGFRRVAGNVIEKVGHEAPVDSQIAKLLQSELDQIERVAYKIEGGMDTLDDMVVPIDFLFQQKRGLQASGNYGMADPSGLQAAARRLGHYLNPISDDISSYSSGMSMYLPRVQEERNLSAIKEYVDEVAEANRGFRQASDMLDKAGDWLGNKTDDFIQVGDSWVKRYVVDPVKIKNRENIQNPMFLDEVGQIDDLLPTNLRIRPFLRDLLKYDERELARMKRFEQKLDHARESRMKKSKDSLANERALQSANIRTARVRGMDEEELSHWTPQFAGGGSDTLSRAIGKSGGLASSAGVFAGASAVGGPGMGLFALAMTSPKVASNIIRMARSTGVKTDKIVQEIANNKNVTRAVIMAAEQARE